MRRTAIVVGAGIAGCMLASRIASRFDVTLIEAGRADPPQLTALARGDRDALAHPPTWSLPAQLTASRRWDATPGRALGGSSVVNGGYFIAPADADLRAWHDVGGDAWDPERVRAHVDEAGRLLGARPAPLRHPISRAFTSACTDAGRSDGLLRLETTVTAGAPRNAAEAFLPSGSSTVTVRTDCRALRVVVAEGRAVGVEAASGDGEREVLTADEIVLAAGAFGTARLLLASGIGPVADLSAAGVEPVLDLPGVGAAFSDHATVWVDWRPTDELRRSAEAAPDGAFPLALQVARDGGIGDDLEILPCLLPPALVPDDESDAARFGVLVGLQRPVARGTVRVGGSRPFSPLRISYGYLDDDRDRGALRAGVRVAAGLLSSPAFGGLVAEVLGPDASTLDDDRLLDAWIAERIGSAAHTCGTAPMGAASDERAVVDGAGRVHGVEGLRVADTSVLPVVPSRGPAAAAAAIGAVIADQM